MDNKLDTITNLFEGKEIRSIWDSGKEEYFFSVVDIISALTDSNDPAHYWRTLKSRMLKEGNETVTNCDTFKLKAKDGKMRNTDILLTDLGEIATRDIAQSEQSQGFKENMIVAKRGGKVANDARKSYEMQTKKSAISKENALNYKYIDDKKTIEDKKSKN